MILDFSIPDFLLSSIKYKNLWEKEIFNFLQEYNNDFPEITVQTSGSTGVPKRIKIQKKFMKNSARMTADYFNLQRGQTALLCLPVEYIAGKMMLVRALELGLKLICVKPSSQPLESLITPIDFCAMTPMQVSRSIGQLSKVKQLIIGGAAVSSRLQKSLEKIKTQCFATYGMTETVTHIALKALNGSSKSSHYKILNGIKITQDNRNCLVIDCPQLSNERIITNDSVKLYGKNQFQFLGRYDHVINSGGIKIYPEKVEEKLSSLISCRFFTSAITDELLGEKVVLIIESKKPLPPINFEKHLNSFEIPKKIFYTASFIETHSGKVNRKETLACVLKD